ncbi:hypothetical protein C457_01175 [Haloferax prahovense DSM 18310]|uniref:Uncharacterized protein n=1 Tax=Haloferax prahovense (strain DSM 18310 / JCM 13924 / TL6) TaxID=1227461 RepID=M0GSJ2_HALPT|nr:MULTISPECIES: hypothetical protein [Haloferax]ELZ73854.1 hypothetical protein C457_01175 [Haloferax prahovense DSM 18310]RDZ42849.1 hypothetical protein C5B86_14255 [Haloferax sp. Atlit-19N]
MSSTVHEPSQPSARTPSPWWYGVALFPISVLLGALMFLATWGFVPLGRLGSEAMMLSFFAIVVIVDLIGVLVGLLVTILLGIDLHAVRGSGVSWRPSWLWVGAGLIHFVGGVFSPLFVVSVPLLSYYLYRRGKRTGSPSF